MSTQPTPSFRPSEPYNDLPPLPSPGDIETKAVLKAGIESRAALAELKVAVELIPNPAILINTIPLLEARASSAIENIVTTTDRLFRFAQDDESHQADPATKEALRYRKALKRGSDALAGRPLSTATAVEVCRMRATVLPDRQRRRCPHRATSDGGRVSEKAVRDRGLGGSPGGPAEVVHQPAPAPLADHEAGTVGFGFRRTWSRSRLWSSVVTNQVLQVRSQRVSIACSAGMPERYHSALNVTTGSTGNSEPKTVMPEVRSV